MPLKRENGSLKNKQTNITVFIVTSSAVLIHVNDESVLNQTIFVCNSGHHFEMVATLKKLF